MSAEHPLKTFSLQPITHMRSAFWVVDNRWATAMVVRPFAASPSFKSHLNYFFRARVQSQCSLSPINEMRASDRGKRTSPSRRTFGLRSKARAMAMRSVLFSVHRCKKSSSSTHAFDHQKVEILYLQPQCRILCSKMRMKGDRIRHNKRTEEVLR